MLVTAFVLTYFLFDPAGCKMFPKCQFLMLTGWKCPGCGSQRAIHALLTGDVIAAIKYNAIFVLSLPVISVYICGEVTKKRHERFFRIINSRAAIYSLLVMYLVWWVLRNVFNW